MARTAAREDVTTLTLTLTFTLTLTPTLALALPLTIALSRQLEKTLRARAVLPNAIERPLPRAAERGEQAGGDDASYTIGSYEAVAIDDAAALAEASAATPHATPRSCPCHSQPQPHPRTPPAAAVGPRHLPENRQPHAAQPPLPEDRVLRAHEPVPDHRRAVIPEPPGVGKVVHPRPAAHP